MTRDEVRKFYGEKALYLWYKEFGAKGTEELPTGFGKTKLGVDAAAAIAKKLDYTANILILTPTEVLRDNAWRAEFNKWKETKTLNTCVSITCIQTAYKYVGNHYDLVIGDEIHNYLSPEFREFWFNNQIDRILGLSAKIPSDYLHILNEIAPICYSMTIKEAQELGIVSEYQVYNIAVELTEQEERKYDEVDKIIKDNSHLLSNNYTAMPPFLTKAIHKRKEILYSAENKIDSIVKLSNLFPKRDGLIFTKGINNAELIHSKMKDISITYHSGKSTAIRKELMRIFCDKRNKIRRLISIKAINEGVNVPSVSLVILSSYDSKEKNWIQQAGRGLRWEEDKIAYIFNLYCKDTKEHYWLKNKTKEETDMKWFKGIDEFLDWYKTKRDKE